MRMKSLLDAKGDGAPSTAEVTELFKYWVPLNPQLQGDHEGRRPGLADSHFFILLSSFD